MARGIRNKLGRHTRLFIVVTGLTLVAAPVRVLAQPTTYAASCKIQIQGIGPAGARGIGSDDPKKDPIETVGSFETMIDLVQSPGMAARVAEDLKVPVERVLDRISGSLVVGTQVLAFTAVDRDAAFAARLCNAYGQAFLRYRHDGAQANFNTALMAQKARSSQYRKDLELLDARIHRSSGRDADAYRFQRLHVVSKISDVEEEIANIKSARGLGLTAVGTIIQPAGSTGAPVGPNRAFPIGLMVAGVGALAVTALIPRRRAGDEDLKTY